MQLHKNAKPRKPKERKRKKKRKFQREMPKSQLKGRVERRQKRRKNRKGKKKTKRSFRMARSLSLDAAAFLLVTADASPPLELVEHRLDPEISCPQRDHDVE